MRTVSRMWRISGRRPAGAVQPADIGRASGAVNTLQRFGGAFGVALAAAVFGARGHLGWPAGIRAAGRGLCRPRPAIGGIELLSLPVK